MRMRSLMMTLVIICASGCSEVHSVSNKAEDQKEEIKSKLYMSEVCSDAHEAQASKKGAWLQSIDPSKTMGEEKICVDTSNRIEINVNKVHIYAIGPDEIYLKLNCSGSAGPQPALGSMSNGGDLALVIGNEVYSRFAYKSKDDLAKNCGVFAMNDLNDALDFCEAILEGVGGSKASCSEYCDAKKMPKLLDVCIVGNAKSPLNPSTH